jgi:sodium/bile acid cotransporter 7
VLPRRAVLRRAATSTDPPVRDDDRMNGPEQQPPTRIRRLTARLARLPVDPFVLLLLATVGIAALLPARGTGADIAEGAASVAIGLLFFLYGARLSTRDALTGLTHWRLHLTVLLSTYLLFPLLGLAAWLLVPEIISKPLYTGLLFLCLLPSTVQSSIAFTSIARGNVAAAIVAGTYSNLLGIVLTPLLAALLLGSRGASGFSADAVWTIVAQLLLPFLAGQLLRRWIGGFVHRHKRVLSKVDRFSILLVVYSAFSAGMVAGVWHRVSAGQLGLLLAVEAVLLAAVLGATTYGSRKLGFNREDRIAIVFCGSKKSLATGLPMASVLFGGAAVGLVVLPLMLFHQMQLTVCAVIAKRWAREAPGAPDTPGESASPAGGA